MTLIEGVGDEVVQFVAVVLVMTVAALAWWSTNARPDRYRTVLVMRSRSHHPVTLSIQTRSTLMLSPTQMNGTAQASMADTTASANTSDATEEASSNARVIPLQEMDSIVDAHMAMLDNNRLHFYRRLDSPTTAQSVAESTSDESELLDETEAASSAQIREMDSIVSAMEADVTANCDLLTTDNESNTIIPETAERKDDKESGSSTVEKDRTENPSTESANFEELSNEEAEGDRRKILIKLKYLNDTLKEVEGRLDESLKDFKWRHFAGELAAQARVRLIFRGRVLGDEAASLRALGLHHRAVVHCLVHPRRARQQRGPQEEAALVHELGAAPPAAERPWDLENILMTLVSVALTVVWFFRCEYSNMFTASASVALFGLTVFYSVAIFGLYLSDTFQFDRRQAQPVPNN